MDYRDYFSLPQDVTYLNCATMSPLPKSVEAAGIAGLKAKSLPYGIEQDDFFEPAEMVKSKFAQLINCPNPHRIAIMPSVSYGMATLAKNIVAKCNFDHKNKIIVVGGEFPSDVHTWKSLCHTQPVKLHTIEAPPIKDGRGQLWNQLLLNAIDEHSLLVCISPTHWADGTLFDLQALAQKCKATHTLLAIDATQYVGAMAFDITTVNPDFLICATYKWLLGPYGNALAYMGSFFDEGLPLEETWIGRAQSNDFKNLVDYKDQYRPLAYRYNMGQMSNFINLPMIVAGLDVVLHITPTYIHEHAQQLSALLIQKLLPAGYWMEQANYQSAHLLGIYLPHGINLVYLQELLKAEKIFVSFRGNAIRISIHVWNNSKDIEKLLQVMLDPKLY